MTRFVRRERRRGERGQVLVVFSLALVAIVAMTGLVLDGGDTFVRRRDQQNAADLAAMAAGYAYMMNGSSTAAAAGAAWSTAAANGYQNLSNGVAIQVTFDPPAPNGRHITVTISKPHQNNFSGIVGLSSWDVTTTATVGVGWANGVMGAMPMRSPTTSRRRARRTFLRRTPPSTGRCTATTSTPTRARSMG